MNKLRQLFYKFIGVKYSFKNNSTLPNVEPLLPNELVDAFCMAPDSQIDKSIVKRMRKLKGSTDKKFVVDELKSMLDDSVHGSLTSDFGIRVLETCLKIVLEKKESNA